MSNDGDYDRKPFRADIYDSVTLYADRKDLDFPDMSILVVE